MNLNPRAGAFSPRTCERVCTALALCFLGASLAPRTWAKNPDARAEAIALIKKALDVSDIRAPGSPPFELRGTLVVALEKGQNAIGTYQLDWASPDRWREEIHVDNYSRIRVGGAGKYWQQRSLNYELIPFNDLNGAIDYARVLRDTSRGIEAGPGSKVSLKSRKIDGQDATCASISGGYEEFCFDSQTGTLLRADEKRGAGSLYSSFTNFQGKLVPSVFEISFEKNLILSFRLESIAPLGDIDASTFTAPQNADVWPTCDAPVAPKLIHEAVPDFRNPGVSGDVFIYYVVGADGAIHNAKILAASSQHDGDITLQSLKNWKYQPRTCHGVPQPAEVITTLNYENQ